MHDKNAIGEVMRSFSIFRLQTNIWTRHFRAAKSLSARPAANWPHLSISSINSVQCTRKEAKKSTLDPPDRVEVPSDVGKNLRNLGNSQEELTVSSGTFLHSTKINNIWMDFIESFPEGSQDLRLHLKC